MTEPARLDVDLLVIGAGPVGLYGAYYAGFRGLSVAVVDSLPEVGGQVTALYPEKLILDVAGLPAIRGRDLVANLVTQAAPSTPHYLLGHRAETLGVDPDGHPVVTTHRGTELHAGAVVVTAGIGTFTPRPIPVGGEWEGRGLSYFVPRLEDHAGHDVVVVGGGDSAFDWVLNLHPIARSVTLVHRREKFRAHERSVAQARALGVPILTSTEVRAVRGTDWVSEVEVEHTPTGRLTTLPAESVVAALGFTANLGPLADWGLELAARKVVVDSTMASSRPRVYAAGDIATYPGKVPLISVGFGEVATAVNNAATVLDPAAHLFPGHSSELAV
jgi:ferredoxin/flavodoxin---NADP+ reductase